MNKKIIIGVLVLIVLISGFSLLSRNRKIDGQNVPNVAVYSNEELGIEFSYKSGTHGYAIQESTPMGDNSGLVRAIVLIPYEDANRSLPVGGEGPATITIQVFKNTKQQSPRSWADEYIQYSNINLKQGEAREVSIGGSGGIRYMADGLYASDNVVVTHGNFIYMVSGMFISEDSALRKDFVPLINSIQFLSPSAPTSQGKIDINTVCEGALAYMTFPDGASADLFVKECKEGKRPEVIEQYKKQMNLGDGAQI